MGNSNLSARDVQFYTVIMNIIDRILAEQQEQADKGIHDMPDSEESDKGLSTVRGS